MNICHTTVVRAKVPIDDGQRYTHFTISSDGNRNFILACENREQGNFGDTWHETIEDAKRAAEELYEITGWVLAHPYRGSP